MAGPRGPGHPGDVGVGQRVGRAGHQVDRLVADQLLHAGDRTIPCSIGKGGLIAAADKREGDGTTPIGAWPIRGVLLRPDRVIR